MCFLRCSTCDNDIVHSKQLERTWYPAPGWAGEAWAAGPQSSPTRQQARPTANIWASMCHFSDVGTQKTLHTPNNWQQNRNNRKILTKNKWFAQKISIFHMFFPFLCPRANCFHRSLLICSFFKSDLSDLLPWLCTKERLCAIHSGCSWRKRDWIDLLFFTSESLFFSQKISKSLEKPMSKFATLPDSPVLNG